jgi:ring-1,2-phenylacetyl-CoA epoxidase subunit PaaD
MNKAKQPAITEQAVRDALQEVTDPEIPNLSIVDLGIVHSVVVDDNAIRVELMPTFVGCPALEAIKESVQERLARLAPGHAIEVSFTFEEPWTTDRISDKGKQVLKSSGFAPPAPTRHVPAHPGPLPRAGQALIQLLPVAECPYCGSRKTVLENPFGPTLCRAIYYCRDCRQPFEQFKQV